MVTPKPLDVVAALERLHSVGLECECVPGIHPYILGGTVQVNDEIRGFENSFAIIEEPNGFTAAVDDCGTYREEYHTVDNLEQAINTVVKIYQQRGILRNE